MSKNKIVKIYQKLQEHYGNLNWWPAETSYEVMVGAILTQNTNWINVEKAIANFKGRLTPAFVAQTENEELIEIIRPSGFFNQKVTYLKAMTGWYKQYDYAVSVVKQQPLEKIRKELLAVKGIGFETADSILLYAFEFPTFVVDAYTRRLVERVGIPTELDYHNIKHHFECAIPPDLAIYNNYHAAIVINAKAHCKKKPICDGCPLASECAYILNFSS